MSLFESNWWHMLGSKDLKCSLGSSLMKKIFLKHFPFLLYHFQSHFSSSSHTYLRIFISLAFFLSYIYLNIFRKIKIISRLFGGVGFQCGQSYHLQIIIMCCLSIILLNFFGCPCKALQYIWVDGSVDSELSCVSPYFKRRMSTVSLLIVVCVCVCVWHGKGLLR